MEQLDNKVFGDSLTAAEWNQVPAEIQNVITGQAIALSSGDLNQLGKALIDLVGRGGYYTDSGGVNTVVLSAIGSNQDPTAYKDGMAARFRPNNGNTGAATVNITSLGVKNIYLDGAPLVTGELVAGQSITIEYDLGNDRFNIVVSTGGGGGGTFLTRGFSIDPAFYENKELDVNPQSINNGINLFIGANGTKLYVMDGLLQTAYQYTMSTPWDLSTATYDTKSFSFSGENTQPKGIFFKDDGLKMYMSGAAAPASIFSYTLGTAWDITTAVYDSISLNVSAQTTAPLGFQIANSGTRLFIIDGTGDAVLSYTFATAWSLATLTYDTGSSFGIATQDNLPGSCSVNDTGTKLFFSGSQNDKMYEYDMSTPYDLTTASYNTVTLDLSVQSITPAGHFFQPNGERMYLASPGASASLKKVFQYVTNYLYV